MRRRRHADPFVPPGEPPLVLASHLRQRLPESVPVYVSENVAALTYPGERAYLVPAARGDRIEGWLPIDLVLCAALSHRTAATLRRDGIVLAMDGAKVVATRADGRTLALGVLVRPESVTVHLEWERDL